MVTLKQIEKSQSKFGSSFQKENTQFYTIFYDNESVGEVEFWTKQNEILSIYIDNCFRGRGIGRQVIDRIFDIYKIDNILAWSAKSSLKFWKSVSSKRLPNNYFLIEKTK